MSNVSIKRFDCIFILWVYIPLSKHISINAKGKDNTANEACMNSISIHLPELCELDVSPDKWLNVNSTIVN